MTLRMNRSVVLLAVLFLSGCVSSARVSAMDAGGTGSSLCEVVENFDTYNGIDVEIKARYVSDGRHEEVLEDLTCSQGRRIIDIGRRGDSESVAKFYVERKRVCAERGASYLCNTSAEVDVSGTINVMSGEFVIDLKEVKNFKFVE